MCVLDLFCFIIALQRESRTQCAVNKDVLKKKRKEAKKEKRWNGRKRRREGKPTDGKWLKGRIRKFERKTPKEFGTTVFLNIPYL